MSAKLSLNIETKPEQLERVFAAVEETGQNESWSSELVFRVNLVLEELILNIINYGHDEGLHEIELTLTSETDAVTIEISDDGKPFDPVTDVPVPDVSAPLDERPIGGLGIHLVRTMMDELDYRRESGRNYLTLVSRRTG